MKQIKINLKQYFKDYDWKVMVKLVTFIGLLFLILTDQLVKFWITKNLDKDVESNFLPGFINIQYVINYGSAFGLNQNKTVLLISCAFLVASVLLVWWIFSKSTTNIVGITFIMAGTIANLIDRFKYSGGVIDFLKWDLFEPKTIFNIADIFITVGIIIIVVFLVVETIKAIINDKKEKKVQQKYGKQNKKV
ncbi:MAG: signal peptidase II [Spiroplasma sp.]